jgi:hypothetical protein
MRYASSLYHHHYHIG